MNKISKNSLLIITIILLVLTFMFGYVFNNYSISGIAGLGFLSSKGSACNAFIEANVCG